MLVVVCVPLPFGAVGPRSRLLLELAAFSLALIWLFRACLRPTRLPGRWLLVGLIGLLLLGTVQMLPIGTEWVGHLSPAAGELHAATRPPDSVLVAEERLLNADPREFDSAETLSVDRAATASALRTGVALGCLLLVATTVAAACGARRILGALLVSGGFQGLYGLLILASGHNMIWNVPKLHYLTSATGTFINRNHFANYVGMAVAAGCGLLLYRFRQLRTRPGASRATELFSREGSRSLLLALPLVVATAGLLASLSRAGIALGLLALVATILFTWRTRGLKPRLLVLFLILAVGLIPLAQLGADQLFDRYADSAENLTAPGGRGRVWLDTLKMATSFPLVGTGYGTFAAVYQRYRSPEVRLFYSHAHNDLVQALSEGGTVGILLLLCLLLPVVRSTVAALSGRLGAAAVGIGAAVGAILLHSLVDFVFHIPANAATAAILIGLLQGLPWKRTD